MSTELAIEVKDVAKFYRKGELAGGLTLAETLTSIARKAIGRGSSHPADDGGFWALDGVSFEVRHGEVVGLIGENGAGKSTLLKVLSSITLPTRGSVRYRGRVGSLLDVGTGFHPELSGRDNVYLSGAILGMSRTDIGKRFDEIVAFSEVDSFIDTPVKRYSSGMYMRLAFAVAAHLETDIVLIDEVLAVGDYKFQQKCLNRMDGIAHDGRTVIFVSHSMVAIQSICPRAIWLEKGRIVADGKTAEVISRYTGAAGGTALERRWPNPSDAPGNAAVRLFRARVAPVDGDLTEPIDVGREFSISFDYENLLDSAEINVTILLINSEGVMVFSIGPDFAFSTNRKGRHRESWTVPGNLLNDGTYHLTIEIRDRGNMLLTVPDVLVFEVQDRPEGRFGWYGNWPGAIRPKLGWRVEPIAGEFP